MKRTSSTICSCGYLIITLMMVTIPAPLALARPITQVATDPPPPISVVPLGIETFDTAWRLVRDNHFDPNLNGVDWDAVRDELRPKALAATSKMELRLVIHDMLHRLGQSHFELLPAEIVGNDSSDPEDAPTTAPPPTREQDPTDSPDPNAPDGWPGITARLVDDQVLVTAVRTGEPAEQAGVGPGWVITAVDGMTIQELRAGLGEVSYQFGEAAAVAMVVESKLNDRVGSTVEVEFLDDENNPITLELEQDALPGEYIKFGNLPPISAEASHKRLPANEHGADIGVLTFNIWLAPLNPPIQAAIDDLRSADGIIIDLRGNPGGVGAMSAGVAGHFIDEKVDLGMFMFRGANMPLRINPRRVSGNGQRVEPFTGPVAILVDGLTGSTSEMFAGGMQALGRARVFGSTSMGAVLPARMDELPNGDVLLNAFADFVTADGTRLEGLGVIPDERTPMTREALLAGYDPPLDAAVRWIVQQKQQSSDDA